MKIIKSISCFTNFMLHVIVRIIFFLNQFITAIGKCISNNMCIFF